MSNKRRARPRRISRYHEMFDENVGVVTGWARDTDAIEDAKKQTHDTLIQLMGNRRTGGVAWRIEDQIPTALALLDKMREGADQPHLELYQKLEELLREHGGVLVIATAPGHVADPRNN